MPADAKDLSAQRALAGLERRGGAGAVPGLRPPFQTIPLHRVNCVLFSFSLGEL